MRQFLDTQRVYMQAPVRTPARRAHHTPLRSRPLNIDVGSPWYAKRRSCSPPKNLLPGKRDDALFGRLVASLDDVDYAAADDTPRHLRAPLCGLLPLDVGSPGDACGDDQGPSTGAPMSLNAEFTSEGRLRASASSLVGSSRLHASRSASEPRLGGRCI